MHFLLKVIIKLDLRSTNLMLASRKTNMDIQNLSWYVMNNELGFTRQKDIPDREAKCAER